MTAVITRAGWARPCLLAPLDAHVLRIDAVRPHDREAITGLFARCSRRTVQERFFSPIREMPRSYLSAVLAGDPHRHDALVMRRRDASIIGLASLVVPEHASLTGEIGVLVEDAWQRRGIGRAMIDALLARARARGVTRVRAEVLADRTALLAALGRTLELHSMAATSDGVTAEFALAARQ